MPNSSNELREIERLGRQIESSKRERDQITGRLESLLESLEEEFGVSTESEAEKERKVIEKELTKLRKRFDIGFKKLKGEYKW